MDYIPDPQHTNIGFITFNNSLQFFVGTAGEPYVICVAEILNPFAPLPTKRFLMNVEKERIQINQVLEKIVTFHEGTSKQVNISCGGAALKAAIEVLKISAGKILLFLMDYPSIGYGSFKVRDSGKIKLEDKQFSIMIPEADCDYVDIGKFCLESRISVDIFACAHGDLDLATIIPVSSKTGGEVNYYHPFSISE